MVILIILSVLLFLVSVYAWIKLHVIRRKSTRTEYSSHYIVRMKFYQAWDELVTVQKTRQVQKGVDSNGNPIMETETYYEDEVHYHGPEYYMILNSGKTIPISGRQYSNYGHVMVSRDQFVNLHRNYYSINGNLYINDWDGRTFTFVPITLTQNYTNPFLLTQSIFNTADISDESAMELGLYKYPPIINHQQSTIIGKEIDEIDQRYYDHANAKVFEKSGMRVYLLFFENKPIEIAEKQRDYWRNGNSNEIVICIGTKGKGFDIQWCHTFSWCDNNSFEVKCKQWLMTCGEFDLRKFASYMIDNADNIEKKDFADFDYLLYGKKRGLKTLAIATLLATGLILIIMLICM